MPKRLILCFDGTWNTPDDNGDVDGSTSTNVHRLYQGLAPADADGMRQVGWYQKGVGTRWYNRLRGGAFGVGLSDNIKAGYRHLIATYEDGDEIFLFGFSRGAYTARSLVGLIRNAGLLREPRRELIEKAYSLYRTRDEGADAPSAIFFRQQYSREVAITCLGVWDTVGALGVPLQSFDWFNKKYYEFHDTELSGIVRHGFQALAIDEHRASYAPTLWQPKHKPSQMIEQAWFAGAHANVGGGYPHNLLADVPLAWMMERATRCGVAFQADCCPKPNERHYLAPVRDSYKEFLKGVYCRFTERQFRALGTAEHGAEALDDSVDRRLRLDPLYRPKNSVRTWITSPRDHSAGRI